VTMKMGEMIVEGLRVGMERQAARIPWQRLLGPVQIMGNLRVARLFQPLPIRAAVPAGGAGGTVTFHIYEAHDPEETAREVVRMLRLNGWV